MNTLKIIVALLLFTTFNSQAQVSVNVNIGTPPVWASPGNVRVDYYFLPEIDAYYDVPAQRFIYISNGRWIRSASLPYRYRNYDLRHGRTVYLTDYRGHSPYQYHKQHKVKYYKVHHNQGNRKVVVRSNNYKSNNKNNDHGDRDHGNKGRENKGHGNKNKD